MLGYMITISVILLQDDKFKEKFNITTEVLFESFSNNFVLFPCLGMIIGSFISSILADKLGRTTVLLYSSVLGIFLISTLAMSRNSTDLLMSMSLVGWIIGICVSVGPIYSAEVY